MKQFVIRVFRLYAEVCQGMSSADRCIHHTTTDCDI